LFADSGSCCGELVGRRPKVWLIRPT